MKKIIGIILLLSALSIIFIPLIREHGFKDFFIGLLFAVVVTTLICIGGYLLFEHR